MPTESGIVMEVKGEMAVVKTWRSEACHNCQSKGFCDAISGAEMIVEARNRAGAATGDRVVIEISEGAFLSGSFIAYFLPVLALVGGIIAGQKLGEGRGWDPELAGLAGGVLLFAGVLLVVRFFVNTRLSDHPGLVPTITAIQAGGAPVCDTEPDRPSEDTKQE